jgi:hypothetical protein
MDADLINFIADAVDMTDEELLELAEPVNDEVDSIYKRLGFDD